MAITEDRRIEGRTKLGATTTRLTTLLVWLVLATIGGFSTTASAQFACPCENTLFTDCDGTPAVQPLTVRGGDIAGRIDNLGQVQPDGTINQFDVVRLVELYYGNQYEFCADLDRSGTLNLGPVTIGGVEFCGDLVLMRLVFGPCESSCRNPQGGNPCNVVSTEPGCTDPNCCSLVCAIDDICCEPNGWDQNCVSVALQACTTFDGNGGGSCLIPSNFPGCQSVGCSLAVCAENPLCCTVAWDQSCVDLAGLFCLDFICEDINNPANCSILPCGEPGLGSCTISHPGPGCADPACCALVCQADPSCCFDSWDTECARAATETCASATAYCGNISLNDNCFTPGVSLDVLRPARGCQDFDCCSLVCQLDPFCCLVTWDQTCADTATTACARYPNCGASGTIDCLEIPDSKDPADNTKGCSSINCCNTVCALDPSCCNQEWDQGCWKLASENCTNCGGANAGSCFSTENNTPSCNNKACCEAICSTIDPFCCDEDLGSWDQQCVVQAELYCQEPSAICGDAQTRNCFLTSTSGGCNDTDCCQEVCDDIDSYCCEISWDAICATTALSLQSCINGNDYQQLGPCLEPHGGKGCNVPACAAAVCALPGQFAFECCEIQWDQNCADLAAQLCYDLLVCPTDAPCDQIHNGIGCEDPFCCSFVCRADPACCTVSWDQPCIDLAENCSVNNPGYSLDEPYFDPTCPCSGSCFEARPQGAERPGCDNATCCAVVCSIDPSCCAGAIGNENPPVPGNWDAGCVILAEQHCCGGQQCGNNCAGGCLTPSDTPYCDDPACCTAVCALDPFCCDTRWDNNCAILAAERCTSGCGIPTSGSCFINKLGSGCDDPDCCTKVCEIDSYCCQTSWDSACVELAASETGSCTPLSCGDYASGACCEINGSPACNDIGCCTAVCAEDPFCCEGGWDELCVFLARNSASCNTLSGCETGPESCQSGCSGSCCIANGTPGCDSQPCCTAVCALDSFCCDNEWDVYCAEQARFTCSYNGEPNGNPNPLLDACPAPKCGSLGSGSCCIPNGSPLCDDEDCCDAVGSIDPYCTTVAWDETCVQLAVTNGACDCEIPVSCGDPTAGSCCTARDTPYCNNGACCTTVCNIDPTCCTIFWSEDCVIWAEFYCAEICGPGGGAPAQVYQPPLPVSAYPSSKPKPKPKAPKKIKPVGEVTPVGTKAPTKKK